MGVFQSSFAVRPLSAAASSSEEGRGNKSSSTGKDGKTALTAQEEADDAITDQIPQRPMGVVEGTSYTVIIVAAIAMAGAVMWAVVNELLIQPREYTAFNLTLDRLREDPRIMVTLGTPVSGYGQESHNRAARQRIPNRVYNDDKGREHVQVQFIARGPSGKGRVSADMYQDDAKQWQYYYLLVDLDGGRGRVSIVDPHHH
ncbi:hypothetical protein WJX75_005641 [Coccomyxa subellipsoidea]|uniref:Mitochondrial import inner membrane translocase subunit Tim21 n=1 Tax=Coccomyxa subellipsoidea TaxID=248742 RepID=A0ABR2YHV7_9CHLO